MREFICQLFLLRIKVYKTRHSTYCLSHLDMYIIVNIRYTPLFLKSSLETLLNQLLDDGNIGIWHLNK